MPGFRPWSGVPVQYTQGSRQSDSGADQGSDIAESAPTIGDFPFEWEHSTSSDLSDRSISSTDSQSSGCTSDLQGWCLSEALNTSSVDFGDISDTLSRTAHSNMLKEVQPQTTTESVNCHAADARSQDHLRSAERSPTTSTESSSARPPQNITCPTRLPSSTVSMRTSANMSPSDTARPESSHLASLQPYTRGKINGHLPDTVRMCTTDVYWGCVPYGLDGIKKMDAVCHKPDTEFTSFLVQSLKWADWARVEGKLAQGLWN